MSFISKIIFGLVLILFLSACQTNKSVDLYSDEPFFYELNNLYFNIAENKKNFPCSYWIRFSSWDTPIRFFIRVDSDFLPDRILVKTIHLTTDKYGVDVEKNINKLIYLEEITSFKTRKKYWGSLGFDEFISTSDLVNSFNERNEKKITSEKLFDRFSKIKKVYISINIEYVINGTIYTEVLKFNLIPKKVIIPEWWDAMMSV